MGWTTAAVIANKVIIEGDNGELLVYNGPAALSDLIASIAGLGGIDPEGNPFQPGVTSYNGPNFLQLFGGQAQFDNGAFISEGGDGLVISGVNPNTNYLNLLLPLFSVLTASSPSNPAVSETWHNMALQNSWAVNPGGYAQYKLEANNRVSVRGHDIAAGTLTGGTVIWTPPNGFYEPIVVQPIDFIIEAATTTGDNTPRFDTNPAGFQVHNLSAGITTVGFNASYAVD